MTANGRVRDHEIDAPIATGLRFPQMVVQTEKAYRAERLHPMVQSQNVQCVRLINRNAAYQTGFERTHSPVLVEVILLDGELWVLLE